MMDVELMEHSTELRVLERHLSSNLVYMIDEELMEHDLTKELIGHINPNQRRNLFGWAPFLKHFWVKTANVQLVDFVLF